MLVKVAVTGGLSCGKSSTCRFFKDLGAHVVSADKIVHQLMLSPNTSIGKKIISLMGENIVVNGQIDRHKIAEKVFNDRTLLQSLESIIHPAVSSEIDKQYQQEKERGMTKLFVAEIPLLFETGGEVNFDYTIVVDAPPTACRERFKSLTGYGDDEYNKRMARQYSPEDKKKRADYVIENHGNLEDMHQTVKQLYNKLCNLNHL